MFIKSLCMLQIDSVFLEKKTTNAIKKYKNKKKYFDIY